MLRTSERMKLVILAIAGWLQSQDGKTRSAEDALDYLLDHTELPDHIKELHNRTKVEIR